MSKCRKCGQILSSSGYCTNCVSYDDLTTTEFKITKSCDVCNKKFNDLTQFEEHIKTHQCCNLCGEYFRTEIELEEHFKKHQCPFCNDYFHPLGNHMSSHMFCSKQFVVVNYLFLEKKIYLYMQYMLLKP
jgi:uncharacterized CHY-type Zn-finger protein